MQIINRKGIRITLLILIVMLAATQFSFAAPRIDVSRDVSVTVRYVRDGAALDGASFSMYRVADVSEFTEFTLADDFSSYSVDLEYSDSEGWRDLAHTLDGYVQRDGIKAYRQGRTDAQGRLVFSGNGMKPGLYLITGDKYTKNGRIYTAEPLLICLPDRDSSDKWNYDPVIQPKASVTKIDEGKKKVSVVKVWKDEKSSKRPDSVSIQLLRDGKVHDTVMLSEKNDWKYTWKGLDSRCTWRAVEKKVPAGYKVTSVREGDTFVVTNILKSTDDEDEKLPQTGVLWWPGMALFTAGVIILAAGAAGEKRSRKCRRK